MVSRADDVHQIRGHNKRVVELSVRASVEVTRQTGWFGARQLHSDCHTPIPYSTMMSTEVPDIGCMANKCLINALVEVIKLGNSVSVFGF